MAKLQSFRQLAQRDLSRHMGVKLTKAMGGGAIMSL
jgi:hypothetical protein